MGFLACPNHHFVELRGCSRSLSRLLPIPLLVISFYECPEGTYIIMLAQLKRITTIIASSSQENVRSIIA
jgi:hypothetical protein